MVSHLQSLKKENIKNQDNYAQIINFIQSFTIFQRASSVARNAPELYSIGTSMW